MFNFPIVEKLESFKFKNNFLKTVIFQLKYNQNEHILKSKEYFHSFLQKNYPNVKDIIKGQVQFKIDKTDKTPVIVSGDNTTDGFEFRSKNGNKILSVTADTISYTILGNEYINFESEFSEFNEYVQNISKHCSIQNLTRIAIRKINLFEFQPDETNNPIDFLSLILKEQFVSSMFSFPSKQLISAGLMRYDFIDHPYRLKLSYGLTPPKNSSAKSNLATLDIDIFNNTSSIDLNNFETEMKSINQSIYNVFDYVVTQDLKEIMNT